MLSASKNTLFKLAAQSIPLFSRQLSETTKFIGKEESWESLKRMEKGIAALNRELFSLREIIAEKKLIPLPVQDSSISMLEKKENSLKTEILEAKMKLRTTFDEYSKLSDSSDSPSCSSFQCPTSMKP